ncbi:MAG: hypothetical protein ABIF10_08395 [Candidatus Woesearchaeota archaeon]
MKYAVIFHADAESIYTIEYCRQNMHEIKFLILPKSANQDSIMFSDTSFEMIQFAARCMNFATKTAESDDELEEILSEEKNSVDGLAVGNIHSRMHYVKLSSMCKQHNRVFTATLWHQDKMQAISALVNNKYSMIIIRTNKMNADFLGQKIDRANIQAISDDTKAGGSFGTLVTAGPLYQQEIKIKSGYATMHDQYKGVYNISEICPLR